MIIAMVSIIAGNYLITMRNAKCNAIDDTAKIVFVVHANTCHRKDD